MLCESMLVGKPTTQTNGRSAQLHRCCEVGPGRLPGSPGSFDWPDLPYPRREKINKYINKPSALMKLKPFFYSNYCKFNAFLYANI